MNELITILIVLAAIASFINKMLEQKKRSQRSESQPKPPEPTTAEPDIWEFPWLDKEQLEAELPEAEDEYEEEAELEAEAEPFAEKTPSFQTSASGPETKNDAAEIPSIEEDLQQEWSIKPKGISGVRVNLRSRDMLKQGIVLAEILGPCRAKKKSIRFKF